MKNLKEELQGMLDDNWSIEEKLRFLYLKICELYTYNLQFSYASNEYRELLINMTTNLEDNSSKNIICTYWARNIYLKIIKDILNIEGEVLGTGHLASLFTIDGNMIKADALLGSDVTRVKLDLTTNGYSYLNMNDDKLLLEKIDKKIGYIYKDSDYRWLNKTLTDKYGLHYKNMDIKGLTKYKLEMMKKFILRQEQFVGFYDYKFAIDYFLRKACFKEELENIKFTLLGEGIDENLIFYYLISSFDNYYLIDSKDMKLKEITKEDNLNYWQSFNQLKRTI